MMNLATFYSSLERHDDALVLREKTLDFQRRVLPENHPDIGARVLFSCCCSCLCQSHNFFPCTAMLNLASTYSKLGRHNDALALQERTLEFWRRVLPKNHPKIGAMR